MLMDASSTLLSTGAMFVIGFVLLFLIYYFTSPIYTEYGDRKSRLLYSIINSLYFSLVLAVLFLALPALSDRYGILASLAGGVVIIIASTTIQVLAITTLIKRRIINIRQKRRRR